MTIIQFNVLDSFHFLSSNQNSYLIDTRSQVEWLSTGIPDLSSINKETILIEWSPAVDKYFLNYYKDLLFSKFNKDDNLFFICRSGVRSFMAAKVAVSLGFKNCFNIIDGFSNENPDNWKNNLPTKSIKHH